MYKFIVLSGMLLLGISLQAQTYEEWLKQEQANQEEMARKQAEGLDKLRKEYSDFVTKRDREFADFLKKRWTEFRIFKGELPPPEPKPREVPIAVKVRAEEPVMLKFRQENPYEDRLIQSPIPRIRKEKDVKRPVLKGIVCEFYGTEFRTDPDRVMAQAFRGTLDEKGFSDYWLKMGETNYDELLDELFNLKQQLGLSDWGYYMLVKKWAGALQKEENSRQMLIWFLLNKSGYVARLGYDKEKVAVMLPACQQIYELPYVAVNGERYYITRELDKIYSYEVDFAGSDRKMDLRFSTALNFPDRYVKERKLQFQDTTLSLAYNQKVIDFYNDYPPTDWEVYFNAPVSAAAKESLASNLWSFLHNISTDAQVGVLLKFLQHSFPYQTDEEQFGKEKYFFPEEILAYPYSDCEDRAAFFAYLEKTFVGLPVVGLSYPGHVSAAVKKTEGLNGDYISYQNDVYIACDPTYIGANPGMSMPQFRNTEAEIIPVEGVLLSREEENSLVGKVMKAGGIILDRENHILIDVKGNVYIAGVYKSDLHLENKISGNSWEQNLFLTKMNRKGRVDWTLTFGGKGKNRFSGVKMLGENLFLSGVFEGKAHFGSITLDAERQDIFIVKMTPEGKVIWASKGNLPGESEDEGMHYVVRFDREGKLLACNVQPDELGMPQDGIVFTRQNECVISGNLGQWNEVNRESAAGKQSELILDVSELLKELSDTQMKQNTDKSIAGLLAVISLINTRHTSVSGEMAVQTLDKYNPDFKKRCPNIYKNIRKVGFIKNEDGMIRLKTVDGKPVNFDKVQVKDGSRMRATVLPEDNVLVQIIDGIRVGKAFIWFKLNKVTLYRSTGNMLFDYDSDHTLKTFNLGKDILN